MDFRYFKGQKEEMSDLLDGTYKCSICGNDNNNCFSLEYTITDKFSQDEKVDKVGCVNCLQKGEFEFWHDTEYGVLDEKGLRKVYNHNKLNPPSFAEKIKIELRRTPQIITWQQELWLAHCNDFMIYKGTWTPEDFNKNSKDGNGRKLFLEMTDEDWNHLWDESLVEGEIELKEWYATYYVFECIHCRKLRGNWDCD